MEERALFAIIISIVIIIIYQFLFMPKNIKQKEEKIVVNKLQEIENKKEEPEELKKEKNIQIDSNYQRILESQKSVSKKEFTIETEKYRTTITNLNGKIISLKLKEFYEKNKYETMPLKWSFWQNVANNYLSILNKEKEGKYKHVELITEDNENKNTFISLKKNLNEVTINESDIKNNFYNATLEYLDTNQENKILKMNYIDDNGIFIEKELIFYRSEYTIDLKFKFTNYSNDRQNINYTLLIGPGIGKDTNKASRYEYVGPSLLINDKKIRIKPKAIKGLIQKEGTIKWIAIENNYFTNAIITKENSSKAIFYKTQTEDDELVGFGLKIDKDILLPNETIEKEYTLYCGPKREEDIKKISKEFVKIIEYGFFSFLAKPLIWTLKLLYKYIPNYGIAIIILTILLKLIFWPLTEKSFTSMKKMQLIQPKMGEIRQKYKNDPAKMNKEVMNLYKIHGVNPFGGCLPMILQIPVFFALYEGLLVSIEMRNAPFMLWIKDLSAMDPLLITPILMGITMYIQQKMMPSGMDSQQAKMMSMIPIIFMVFFLGFPSGLVIYWLLNNVLTIGHQYLIVKKGEIATTQ